ncbi:protein kinase domain protein [Ichthyophthirius multifiliis]|uniref:Protein kinase domain protein n=1 Tax=Ichthyophthirius multifiliis TaxID=5932 RepID=G0QM74_ICHMU|nr:protein kinase domain protein [Ichthyophthirius multifiliis]EGR33677.1 protein kinase domain protein [Ichthyophthirius multifiliis]|eukprot:XP_004037663.1 protein kinase domain protein [Ichthyophthirius multifiliis]
MQIKEYYGNIIFNILSQMVEIIEEKRKDLNSMKIYINQEIITDYKDQAQNYKKLILMQKQRQYILKIKQRLNDINYNKQQQQQQQQIIIIIIIILYKVINVFQNNNLNIYAIFIQIKTFLASDQVQQILIKYRSLNSQQQQNNESLYTLLQTNNLYNSLNHLKYETKAKLSYNFNFNIYFLKNSSQNNKQSTIIQPQLNTSKKIYNIYNYTYLLKGIEYIIETYQNNQKYEGQKLNGMRHGKGKFSYQDGGYYNGEWFENKMHGKGTLYYASGNPAYEGDWIEDKFEGYGILYNENPLNLDQQLFEYKNLDNVDEYWIKYDGQFKDDNKEGFGTLFLSNGEKFCGLFQRDNANGTGSFFCKDGNIINGKWDQNKLM